MLLDAALGVFGGRDDTAGGTWLGINRGGVVAALLNRRTGRPIDPFRPSRGQLCLSMLRCESATAARAALEAAAPRAHNPFNLLVADAERAWIGTNHEETVAITDLDPGLHLITNLDLNDPTCPRIAASYQLFAALLREGSPPPGTPEFRHALRMILSAHDTQLDPRSDSFGNSLCLHSAEYGTRSSTILWLDTARRWTYWHANDAPCRKAYEEQRVMEALAER